MKTHIKKIVSLIVVFSIFFTSVLPFSASGENLSTLNLDGTQSSWAEPELKEAYSLNLTYPDVMSSFKKNITREEFCTIAIKLYEKLTGKTASSVTDPTRNSSSTGGSGRRGEGSLTAKATSWETTRESSITR